MSNFDEFKVGDLVEVIRKDDKKFECIVIEKYEGGFVGRVLRKDDGIGVSSWDRYSLEETSRVQTFSDCTSIKLISESKIKTAKNSLMLNESVTKSSDVTYYVTDLGSGSSSTLCMCEGYGGWSFSDDESQSLKESYLNSQISLVVNESESSEK